MVRGLGIGRDTTEHFARVEGGREDGVLEKIRIDVVGATEGGECAASLEEFEGAEMDFFVAAQGARDGSAISGEGWRVKDDEVPAGDNLFVRLRGGLGAEPIEHVGGFEGAFVSQSIGGSVAGGSRNGIGALVEEMDLGGTSARGVEAEPAEEAEAIEDLRAFCEVGDELIVELLVEVEAGFVAGKQVGFKFEVIQIHGEGTR